MRKQPGAAGVVSPVAVDLLVVVDGQVAVPEPQGDGLVEVFAVRADRGGAVVSPVGVGAVGAVRSLGLAERRFTSA
jgi:hypothetical protein